MGTANHRVTGRPTWAEIDLDALAHNLQIIKKRMGPGVAVLAAIKANAYGHGAVACAQRLEKEGVDWFGVALPEEGVELRTSGITKPILCLGGFWQGQENALIQYGLTPVVYRLDRLEMLNRTAAAEGITAGIHVKIDTGMGRLGIRLDEVAGVCDLVASLPNIRVDGVMTHLASADLPEQRAFTNEQLKRFSEAVEIFRRRGLAPRYIHAANSAAAFAYPESKGNLIRPGGSLYGFIRDVFPADLEPPPLRPVLSLHSRITLLKKIARGECLGYGCTFETKRDSLIATLPIGYDDGYQRGLSNRGRVIVRGQFAPVVGRVSMDLTIVDVTEVEGVALDDVATLLGSDGELTISAEDIAQITNTISYEVTCGISDRVPRVFIELDG